MKNLFFFLFVLSSTSLFAHPTSLLEIIKLGHPTLRSQAEEVSQASFDDEDFQRLIDDMIETMSKAGGVGLAAPQVNKSLRMFVMKSWPSVPLTVVINPRIEYLEAHGQKDSTEGCLSIPGRSLTVKRYKKIHLSYFTRRGEYISKELSGFAAIIAQHEYDHLNGVLIVDLTEMMNSKIDFELYFKSPLM